MSTNDKGRVQYDVSPERFIEVWQRSESVDQVATELRMPKPIVMARASGYRSAGVNLKKFPRGGAKRKLDVDALNELIAAMDAQEPQDPVKKVLKGLKQ